MLTTFLISFKLWAAGIVMPLSSLAQSAPVCKDGNFLNFPTWYKYLDLNKAIDDRTGKPACNPKIDSINDFWLIGLASLEILLRVAVLVAIVFVLLGGLKYITSRGDSEKTNKARTTTIDALVGLIIAIIATASVSFIAGRFQG